MGFKIFAASFAAGLVLTAAAASAASVTVGTLAGEIATVDTTTGAVTNSFNPGVGGWFDVAINNGGTAYGVVSGSTLYSLDLGAQTASNIGSTGAFINGLAFGSGGGLFGTGGNGLYSIDTGTGSASLIGAGVGGSFLSSGDIAYAGGTTFYGTSASGCGGIGGDCLWSIDSATGLGTIIGSTGVNQIYGLGIVGGTLFGLSSANDVYSIDTTTGAAEFLTAYTVAGSTGGAAVPPSTVAPIPVPASLPLLAAGLAGFGFTARRKRTNA